MVDCGSGELGGVVCFEGLRVWGLGKFRGLASRGGRVHMLGFGCQGLGRVGTRGFMWGFAGLQGLSRKP